MMQDIKRIKPSLREVLPKSQASVPHPPRPPAADYHLTLDEEPRRRWGWWLAGVAVLVVVGALALSLWWSQATIVLYPEALSAQVNSRLTALANPGEGDIGYQLVTLDGIESRLLPATQSTAEPEKASGTITISNTYGPEPQTLIANTRFETSDGKIYRIGRAVTVPGYRRVEGEIIPGAVEALVTADKPGPEYNIGLTEFTIPGFKGDPRFDKFLVKSKTAMSGGASGERLVPAAASLEQSRSAMKAELKSRLESEARASLPPDFVIYLPAAVFDSQEKILPADGEQVMVEESASFMAPIFRRSELSERLLSSVIGSEVPPLPTVANLDDLEFTLLSQSNLTSTNGEIVFNLRGALLAVSQIDVEQLKDRLIGESRGGAALVLGSEPTLDRYDISFRPPWAWQIPKQAEKVKLQIQAPSLANNS